MNHLRDKQIEWRRRMDDLFRQAKELKLEIQKTLGSYFIDDLLELRKLEDALAPFEKKAPTGQGLLKENKDAVSE